MIKLNKQAETRQQHTIQLEQAQTLLQSQLAYISNKKQHLMHDNLQRNKRMQSIEHSVQALRQTNHSLQQKEGQLIKEAERSNSSKDQLEQRLENLQVARSRMKQELTSLSVQRLKQEQQITSLKGNLQSRDKEYENAEAGILTYQTMLATQKERSAGLQKEIAKIEELIVKTQ